MASKIVPKTASASKLSFYTPGSPPGPHFDPIWARFWSLRGAIFEASAASSAAFREARPLAFGSFPQHRPRSQNSKRMQRAEAPQKAIFSVPRPADYEFLGFPCPHKRSKQRCQKPKKPGNAQTRSPPTQAKHDMTSTFVMAGMTIHFDPGPPVPRPVNGGRRCRACGASQF